MGKKELKEQLEKQLKFYKKEVIASWIMIILGVFTVFIFIGIIFLILGLIGLFSSRKHIHEIELKLAEL